MVNKFLLPVFWALFGVFILREIVMQVPMGPPLRQLLDDSIGLNAGNR